MASAKVPRSKVIHLREKNPCMTLQAIGDACGISRERVRQILSEDGLKTVSVRMYNVCLNCGKTTKNKMFCNVSCQKEYSHITVECFYCGKPIEKEQSQLVRGRLTFCSRSCKGKYYYENNLSFPHRARIYNYSEIMRLYNLTHSPTQVAKELNYPYRVTCTIIYSIKNGRLKV